jgi:hypothetical protein
LAQVLLNSIPEIIETYSGQNIQISTMKMQNQSFSALSRHMQTNAFVDVCENYFQRLDALSLVQQLIQILKAVQRHRGMSMGSLGGTPVFQQEIHQLQAQLGRHFQMLEVFSHRSGKLINPLQQENLLSAWITISQDWQEDSVILNYELHCHLIEQLLTMISGLGKQLETPLWASINEPQMPGQRFNYLEMLHFSTRLMPEVAEQIGRIRALATYVSASHICDQDFRTKLSYLIQCTRVNNEKLRHHIKRVENKPDAELILLNQLKSYEVKLAFLLSMVENDILGDRVQADSRRIFDLASDIIDLYLKAVTEGTQVLQKWLEVDIQLLIQANWK